MKGKIFISFICALIFLVVTFAFLYNSAKEDKTKGHETAIQAAKEHGFASIDEVNTFYNRNVYYIIQGKNKKGEKIIGWMKKGNTDKILIKKAKEGLSKDDVLQLIQNIDNSKPKKIKKIMLGYDDTDSKNGIYRFGRSNILTNKTVIHILLLALRMTEFIKCTALSNKKGAL